MIFSESAVQVKHAGIDRNPETRVFGLSCATLGAVLLAELFDLIVITRPLRAFERRRRLGSKLRWARQGERSDVRDCPADRDRSGYVNDGPGLWPVSVGGRGSIIPQPTSSTRSPVRRLSAARTTPRRTARSCDSAIACCRLAISPANASALMPPSSDLRPPVGHPCRPKGCAKPRSRWAARRSSLTVTPSA